MKLIRKAKNLKFLTFLIYISITEKNVKISTKLKVEMSCMT